MERNELLDWLEQDGLVAVIKQGALFTGRIISVSDVTRRRRWEAPEAPDASRSITFTTVQVQFSHRNGEALETPWTDEVRPDECMKVLRSYDVNLQSI